MRKLCWTILLSGWIGSAGAQFLVTGPTSEEVPATSATSAAPASASEGTAVQAPAAGTAADAEQLRVENPDGLTTGEQREWLTDFDQIRIDGPMSVTLVRTPADEAPRIVYDTKGSYTSRFRAAVNKSRVLEITERTESRRTTTTEVTVYYHSLEKIRITRATVSFAEPLDFPVTDMTVSGGAVVTATLKMRDLKLDISGRSRLTLSGEVPYLSLRIASAKLDATALKVTSALIEASNSAEANVTISERLEAYASSGAQVFYSGTPDILRTSASLGGKVSPATAQE